MPIVVGPPADSGNTCPVVLQACAIRLARLDAIGVPAPGPNNLYVSDGMIELTYTEEVEKGTDVTVKNGRGDICASFRTDDLLKRVTLNLVICPYDPELFELLRGGTVLRSGERTGYAAPRVGIDPTPSGVSLEVWMKRRQHGGGDDTFAYEQFVFPRTYWTFGGRKLEDGVQLSVLDGWGQENPNWFNGPGNDWPVASTSCYASLPTNSLPTPHCGAQTLSAS